MKQFMELELEVAYTYCKGYAATREEPGEPSRIEIESVKYNGQEIELTEQDSSFRQIYIQGLSSL